jgi:hypothetical protein
VNSVFIEAIGLAGPGLPSWAESIPTLRGESAYFGAALSPFTPTVLPANEQRRATATVRIAFRVAEEAVRNSERSADELATVFASSDADMLVSHRICTALAQSQRLVSPTDFHNSVHNAPSGYWHIGAHSHHASSAVAGHDHSFAVGLLEAITQVQIEGRPTLLVCYDVPAPEPLLAGRPLENPFAVAMLLSPAESSTSLARIGIATASATDEATTAKSPHLEALRLSNPAARCIPLLQRLALRQDGGLILRRSAQTSIGIELHCQ